MAHEVAIQLTEHDALGAHARDELGINDIMSARPLQAAVASGAAFTVGALLPLVVTLLSPLNQAIAIVGTTSLVSLAILGGVAAKVGGANVYVGIIRVTFWGILAMLATALIGNLFGVMSG